MIIVCGSFREILNWLIKQVLWSKVHSNKDIFDYITALE
jgi:hypothetical protein